MSERYRDGQFALVVILLAGLIFALGHWAGTHSQNQRSDQQEREAEPGAGALDARTFWRVHPGTAKTYQAICDQPIDETQADLCQQWRSAQKAEEIAGYTLVSIFIGLAGIAGLAYTVRYAKEAATAAHRSSAKATVANVIARDTARAELRAYLTLEPNFCGSFDTATRCAIRVEVKNDGNTPARNIRIGSQVVLIRNVQGNPVSPTFHPTAPPHHGFALSKGQPITHTKVAERLFTQQEIDDIAAFRSAVGILIRVEYEDVFGQEHAEMIGSFIHADAATLARLTALYIGKDLSLDFMRIPGYGEST